MSNPLRLVLIPLLAVTSSAAPPTVRDTTECTAGITGLTVVKGSIDLPRGGYWTLPDIYRDHDGLIEIHLRDDHESAADEGERSSKLKDRAAIRKRLSVVAADLLGLLRFAQNGADLKDAGGNNGTLGTAPTKLDGLKTWGKTSITPEQAAGIHLIPGVRIFNKVDGTMKNAEERSPLLIDTTPAIDDGKHWLINNLGKARREEIDRERMKALGITIKPQAKSHLAALADLKPTKVTYDIYARRSGPPGITTFTIHNDIAKQTLEVSWDTRKPTMGDPSICKAWPKHASTISS